MTIEKKGSVRVAILGLGTVGGGVYKTIQNNRETIRKRTGYEVEVTAILVRDLEKERLLDIDLALLTQNPEDVLNGELDVLIEVMGGLEPANTVISQALRSGRHVITANKELMAKHGAELLAIAEEHGAHLLFEASVAGGIPVIRMLQGYLTANRVKGISGILNGTCNYILTEMARTGREYAEILEDAKALGYAEADPTSDVEGYDAAYKLAILTNLAYDAKIDLRQIEREGITALQAADLELADRHGYAIKLIGSARESQGGLQLSVRPRLLPKSHPLANINDVFNAVTIQADVVGELTFSGRGAGEFPTASAVIEDLTALLTGESAIRRPVWKRIVNEGVYEPNTQPGAWYVSYCCRPEAAQQIEVEWLSAMLTQRAFVASREAVQLADGAVRQSWLVGGVGEQEVRVSLQWLYKTGAEATTAVLLPVEGEIEPGVEWRQPVSSLVEETDSVRHVL
ncbi:homoserine dehydrogenase [Tumebacillus permanentifrigoris]|uniref:Homoserine dehydrogenase n=1 Tax=Tumebacillus permanentifrigoris TaxID=378543 RepID=A0A316DE07_9BACL|nr:homoserine dehydrogenase [Tumebacillus permanentifrigoris]PWK15868.1 homoserine dehydrogenase [Tumebacillus permanentifrigoris]